MYGLNSTLGCILVSSMFDYYLKIEQSNYQNNKNIKIKIIKPTSIFHNLINYFFAFIVSHQKLKLEYFCILDLLIFSY